jgi:PKD repeat protein
MLNRTGEPDIPASNIVVVSATQITCTFDLLNRTAGTYNLVVTNPDGKAGMRTAYFTLSSPAPTVSGSTPNSGSQGTTVAITNLAGTNFQPNAIVDYYLGSTRLNLTNVNVISRTQITGTLVIPVSATAGSYSVSVLNTDGRSGSSSGRFTVISTVPTVTSMTNTTGYRGWPVIEQITGTNFVSGAVPMLNRTGYSDIIASDIVVVSSTQITCTFDLLEKNATTYNLVVTNPDGRAGMRTNYFTLSSPAPGIPSSPAFSPSSGARGATVIVTAPGTRLQPNMAVILTRSSTTLVGYNVNVVSPTSVIFTVDIPAGASIGSYSAQYINTDGRTGSRTNRFSVTAPTTPIASFTGTPTSGTAPLTVAFTDTSANSPTSWFWTFGDGATSTVQNPSHQYTSAGSYTVSLMATNAAGSNTVTRTNYITASTLSAPTASFTGSPNAGTVPLTVAFTDTSANSPTSWSWTFGDGGTSTSQNPSHQYTMSGSYTVSLTVANAAGSNTLTRMNYITVSSVPPPVASFTGSPTSGTAPLTVTFTDSSSGSPTSWSWTFGDGGTSTSQNPTHQYTTPGTYTVVLTATNAGGSNTLTRANYITAGAPLTAAFTFAESGNSGNVVFQDASTGSPTSWSWTFGDGGTSTVQNPSHKYKKGASYIATLTIVRSSDGATSTVSQTVTV